ncbi:hypothetical protein Q5H91_04410 [Sphingomonas sp. KR1UV-12]|uniref:Uncharacterized protein n=1 Tax=Sphingomonas aurea TaxID=3063994 RepID=A0ABT9EHI9_9SPHN|nr:hypothetical protein [Sphingomonas sp. KR1UV-12]MDP1026445.1 hypothetical protein [Sphingomonas sp. KR1UV-12]
MAAEEPSAGARLEAAAIAQGLVHDPAAATLVGAWARDTDRACVVEGVGGVQRIGIVSDYGDGQDCSATGIVERKGERLRVTLGECRIDATFDGERIVFPGEVPPACTSLCRGRASLAAFAVERQSESASEAATLRGRGGRRLCE